MKKIMFNDKYGLTEAVLSGRKTITRRLVPCSACNSVLPAMKYNNLTSYYDFVIEKHRHFDIGEEVAIAQRYSEAWNYYQLRWMSYKDPSNWRTPDAILGDAVQETKGWNNKMFVKAETMPHRIRITGIKVERLQDISDDDCVREGIEVEDFRGDYRWGIYTGFFANNRGQGSRSVWFNSPRKAFAALFDRVCKHGTWQKNPFVLAYSFDLVR